MSSSQTAATSRPGNRALIEITARNGWSGTHERIWADKALFGWRCKYRGKRLHGTLHSLKKQVADLAGKGGR